jgi:UDP-N-acetylmuramoylalanine--D-glutamate ligase
VINAADHTLFAEFRKDPTVTWFNSPPGIWIDGQDFRDGKALLPITMPEHMPGKHNRSNVAAALTAVRKAGFELDAAISSLSSYQSLPHRLQVLGQQEGVTWINDSIASTPVATAAALESLAGKSVILLIGGLDRGLDWSSYVADFMANTPKALIALPDNGPAVAESLKHLGLSFRAGQYSAENLQQAVTLAQSLAEPGDIVLLSPGAPSFPHFTDFQHRGREFARLAGL